MTYRQVIGAWCRISALVAHAHTDFSEPADCICKDGAATSENFRHAGRTIAYAKDAILEKMQRDGITPDAGALAEIEAMLA
jgi:hypothetical protein